MFVFFIVVKRRKIGNFGRRDNYFIGVFIGVTGDFFQFARYVDQRFNFFIRFVDFRQLRFGFKRFRQRYFRIGRDQFRDTIDKVVRMFQYAVYVADYRFRRYCIEGDDLRYRITIVYVRYVFDNLIAFFYIEVNVEVRYGDTFRVKETFEQQVKFQRIEVGDFQRVGYQ